MDGHLDPDGMDEDLRAMKAAGVGGAIFLEVGLGLPPGPVQFMSEKWQQLVSTAFREADDFGIEIALAAGPGWCGTGGPWVKPEWSMQHLVASELKIQGPATLHDPLPRPAPRKPFFGEDTLTPELHRMWQEFYLDVVVLAFPTPSGNAGIADVDEKALYQRGSYSSQIIGPYSSRPWVRPFLPATADYPALPEEQCIAASAVRNLSALLASDGRLDWEVPAGNWTILRMGRTLTGQTTRPAPNPGLGFESDKFSRVAIEQHFDHYLKRLIDQVGRPANEGSGWHTIHFDSWEMGSQNWSERFGEEFKARRGYDLTPYLPVFLGYVVTSLEKSERFLWDVRQTAQELVIENQADWLRNRGRVFGMKLSLEPYDLNPCADLALGSAADVPQAEFWSVGDVETTFSVVEATSVGHTCGHTVIAAESFTADPIDLWLEHPASLKNQADWALCAGINRIIFHRFQAQPGHGRSPGMTMGTSGGYGVHWDRTQTWWEMASAFHLYLTRCQHMLTIGRFVADVLYLAVEGAPSVFIPPASAFLPGRFPDRRGYNFDGCSSRTLMERASVKGGRICFPDGMSYRLLVLPQVETMTPESLGKVAELVEAGATVLGMPPVKSPSLSGYPDCDARVQRVAARLWNGSDTAPHRVGKGSVHLDSSAAALRSVDPLRSAQWIENGFEDSYRPVSYSRTITLRDFESMVAAEITVTAAVAYRVFLNGYQVAAGREPRQVRRVDVSSMLTDGQNLIRIELMPNSGKAPGPQAVIAALTLMMANGKQQTIATDKTWTCSSRGTDAATKEIGGFTSTPWKLDETCYQEACLYPSYQVTSRALRALGVVPDFDGGEHVRFIHRNDFDRDVYMVGNRKEESQEVTCAFRVDRGAPEWWSPLTGERRRLSDFEQKDGITRIPLRLEPLETGFVVFEKTNALADARGTDFRHIKPMMTMTGPWRVSFDPNWGGPAEVVFEQLDDWTERSEEGIRYYSGKATYNIAFEVPSGSDLSQCAVSLGEVHNIASVKLNGTGLGISWCAPWRLAIPKDVLHAGRNTLEIVVANLWTNRLILDSSLPLEKRLTWMPDNPFKRDYPLQKSGLLGPVIIEKIG